MDQITLRGQARKIFLWRHHSFLKFFQEVSEEENPNSPINLLKKMAHLEQEVEDLQTGLIEAGKIHFKLHELVDENVDEEDPDSFH